LRRRYEQGKGFQLDSPHAKPLLVRYTGGEATRRYYQDAAIRAVLEKLARGEQRALKAAGGSCSAPESAQLGAVVQFMHPPGRAGSSPLNLPGRL